MAISVNFEEDGSRTRLGELEYRAKYSRDPNAITELVNWTAYTVTKLPYYRDAKYVTAVPPRPEKDFDLPLTIVDRTVELLRQRGTKTQLTNITRLFRYGGTRVQIKGASVEDKWDQWEQSGLVLPPDPEYRGEEIILVDDKYQSGTSIQFVASKLLESGFRSVFGLCLVKTRKDTDNVGD